MMKQQWDKISAKMEAMSARERVLIFAAIAVLLLTLVNMLLLEPLAIRQKVLQGQVSQQQQLMSAVQSQIVALQQENSPNSNSPQRLQISQFRQEIAEGDAFLKNSRERLVQPEKMGEHLRQLLSRNNRLQLVALQTLPVTPLIDVPDAKNSNASTAAPTGTQDKQVFKHGVKLTLRGNYLDLLQYLSALEKLPQQMFWAKAQMSVVQYPNNELTLILYTLSLDKTWLQI